MAGNIDRMATRIPELFRPILWSYDFDRLDTAKHRKTLIVQAINYGTLDHWRWLVHQYGVAQVQEVISSVRSTEIRPRARRLAALLFREPDILSH